MRDNYNKFRQTLHELLQSSSTAVRQLIYHARISQLIEGLLHSVARSRFSRVPTFFIRDKVRETKETDDDSIERIMKQLLGLWLPEEL